MQIDLINDLDGSLTSVLVAAFNRDAVTLHALCWNHSLEEDWPLVFSSMLLASSDVTVTVQ